MRKLLALIIILIITRNTEAQNCLEPKFRPVLMMNFHDGPGFEVMAGAWGKPVGLLLGLKSYTVTRTKTKKQENLFIPVASVVGRIILSEKFFVSPYITIGDGGYKEYGLRPAIVVWELMAFTVTANYNNANGFGYGFGIIRAF